MVADKFGIVAASKMELLAIYIFDDNLFDLMPFGEWEIRCKLQGIKVT